jgi:hypothetical protein
MVVQLELAGIVVEPLRFMAEAAAAVAGIAAGLWHSMAVEAGVEVVGMVAAAGITRPPGLISLETPALIDLVWHRIFVFNRF